ncbi:hypothetical protein CLG96_13895 [Sphingomonas oleivorans]|uniref:DUF883 domain-containing protein n=1 Tax=Sphingomonas oleivorans TaxID=1735121 RepID=A0A2T5FWP5_9SPHN|nr:hypothetical protein [Sphingomonas oleivorans]PTQ10203.1 hypothetical protein CLG96_13895 [Sphingomonas oleivorans]
MAQSDEPLPDGTDHVVNGAGVRSSEPDPTGEAASAGEGGAREKIRAKFGEKAADLKSQAADKARVYALQGKEKASSTLDDVVKLVDDAAAAIDEKIGPQYGDYARRASTSIAGFTETLRGKDVDELFDDARELVRKSPAVAIGAAAALGFVVARIIKAGMPEAAPSEKPDGKAPTLAANDPIVPVS